MTNTALRTHTHLHTHTLIHINTPLYWLPQTMSGKLGFSLLCACASVIMGGAHHVLMSCCVVPKKYILSVDTSLFFVGFVFLPDVEVSKQYASALFVWECDKESVEKSCPTGELQKYSLHFHDKFWLTSKLRTTIVWPHYQSTAKVPLSKIPNHIVVRALLQDSCLTLTPLPWLLYMYVFIFCSYIHSNKYILCISSKNSNFPLWQKSDFILYNVSVFYVQIEVKKRFNGYLQAFRLAWSY